MPRFIGRRRVSTSPGSPLAPRRDIDLVRRLESHCTHLQVPSGDHDYAVSAGLRTRMQCHLVDEAEGGYIPRYIEVPLLRSFADSHAQLMEADAPPR